MMGNESKLQFLGIGSAFNVSLGNTSAFFKDNNNNLYLIDCGWDVFPKLINNKILDGIDNITVFITHLHNDHTGSLGTLIDYCFWILKKKIIVIYPKMDIMKLISLQGGLRSANFLLYKDHDIVIDKKKILHYQFIDNKHVDGMNSYGLIITDYRNKKVETIYYSGDCRELFINLNSLPEDLTLVTVYQDVSHLKPFVGQVHFDLFTLCEKVTDMKIRKIIHCMHISYFAMMEDIIESGFNCPSTYIQRENI
jgi:hypothetical protein